jgi:hypothetical protein
MKTSKLRSIKSPDYNPRNVCKTQRAKLLRAFDRGASLSCDQIKKRFGTANPSATISTLKKMGWVIKADYTDFDTKYYLDSFQPVPEKFTKVGA